MAPRITPSLWSLAAKKLTDKDRKILDFDVNQVTSPDDVLQQIIATRDLCIRKHWKFECSGKTINLRDVTEKIIVWIDKFKVIGDLASQFDPVHAALPWAGFRT